MTDQSRSPGNGSKENDARVSIVPPPGPSEAVSEHERRRMPRLNLTSEQFRLTQTGKIFSVADLSVDGVALRVVSREDLLVFPVGRVLEGTLNLRSERIGVKLRVRHVGPDLVGAQFEELSEAARAVLARCLDPETLGKELKPIPSSENGALWYHGPSGTDVLFWRALDGQYHRIATYVLGNFVQWDQETGLSTGRVSSAYESSEVRGVVRFETLLIDPDPTPDAVKLKLASTLILSSNVPQDLKKLCSRQLK